MIEGQIAGTAPYDKASLGVGVVGLGEIGQVHLKGVARSSVARLAAVADLDANLTGAAVRATGATPYADIAGLLADPTVDVVSICLPHNLHHLYAMLALAAGKHVLVEKPLALSVDECDDLIAAAGRQGVALGVSHNQLFYPPHVRAKELIDDGTIGRPVFLRLRLGQGGAYPGWRADPVRAGGGILFDAGAHRFYMARLLFGDIAAVWSVLNRQHLTEGESLAVVTLQFASGAVGVIEANFHSPPGTMDDAIEIVGTDAALYLPGIEATSFGFRTDAPLRRFQDRAWHDEPVPTGGWEDSVVASVGAFLDAVAARRPVPVSGRDGREVVRLIRDAYDNATVLH